MFKNVAKESAFSEHYRIQMMTAENLTYEQAKQLEDLAEVDFAEITFEETLTEEIEEWFLDGMEKTEITFRFITNIKNSPQSVFGLNNTDFNTFNSSKDNIIVPNRYSLYHKLNIGDKVNVLGQDFTVAGTLDALDAFILPAAYSIENCKITSFIIRVPVQITDNDYAALTEKLANIFTDPLVTPDYELEISQKSTRVTSGVVMTFAIGAICIMFFYQYILNTRKRQIAIFMLLGMNTRKFVLLIFTELIFTFTLCYCVGAAINIAICSAFDIAIINQMELLRFYILYLAVYLGVAIIFSYVFLKKSSIAKYSESGLA
jgi:ABC-type antimicrobial peptide transport system permease subunit